VIEANAVSAERAAEVEQSVKTRVIGLCEDFPIYPELV
jgi:hypothetical protein